MIDWLKRKQKLKSLQKKYKELLQESYELNKVNRISCDFKRSEAENVLNEMDNLLDAERV